MAKSYSFEYKKKFKTRLKNKLQIYIKKIIVILLLAILLIMIPAESIATTQIVKAKQEHLKSANTSKDAYKNISIEEYLEDNYFYHGVPEGEMTIKKFSLDWVVDFLAQIMDYFLGIMSLGIRLVQVGWGIIAENLIATSVEGLSVKNSTSDKYRKNNIGFHTDSKQTINIENILLNRVEFLNVNLFESDDLVLDRMTSYSITGLKRSEISDEEMASLREDLKKSHIMIFREHFANTFRAFYIIAIILFLIAGIIAAIFSVIKSTGAEKAYYKKISIEWLKSFLQMFLLIVYMVGVLQFNSTILAKLGNYADSIVEQSSEMFTDFGQSYTIFETLRTRAYSLKLSVGAPAATMYLILVWYTVKFLVMYLRRLIIVYVYAIFGPIVMAMNLIQKTLTEKSNIQSVWIREFTLNVLIQSLQAGIYILFIPEIYRMASVSVAGFLLMFMLIRFMFEFETIIRKIFNLTSGAKHSSLENVLTNTSVGQFAAVSAMKSRFGKTEKGFVKKGAEKAIAPIKGTIKTGVAATTALTYNTAQMLKEGSNRRREVNQKLRDEGFKLRGDGARKVISNATGSVTRFNDKRLQKKENKRTKELEKILRVKGSSDDEIALLLGKDKDFALTEDEKDKLRVQARKMSPEKYRKKNTVKTKDRIKNIANELVEEKDGKKRIKMAKLGFDNKTKTITFSNTMQERLKKGFMKEYDIKNKKEYKAIKKEMGAGLRTGTAISGAVLFAPIRSVDKSQETSYMLSAILSNIKSVEPEKRKIKSPVREEKTGKVEFKNIKKAERKAYKREVNTYKAEAKNYEKDLKKQNRQSKQSGYQKQKNNTMEKQQFNTGSKTNTNTNSSKTTNTGSSKYKSYGSHKTNAENTFNTRDKDNRSSRNNKGSRKNEGYTNNQANKNDKNDTNNVNK